MEHFQSEVSFRAGGSILAQPEYIHKSGITLLEEENEYAAMFYIGKDFKAYLRDHDSADLYFDFGGSSITIPVSFTF